MGRAKARGRKELMYSPRTEAGVAECAGWRKGYEGQQEREMGLDWWGLTGPGTEKHNWDTTGGF